MTFDFYIPYKKNSAPGYHAICQKIHLFMLIIFYHTSIPRPRSVFEKFEIEKWKIQLIFWQLRK